MLTFILSTVVALSNILSFDRTDIDLGYIDINRESYQCLFRITNRSDQPIEISDIKTSCGCTTATWTNGEIPPGKIGIIRVEYHPEACFDGYFERKIFVHIKGQEEIANLIIHGTYSTPEEIDFKSVVE